MVSNTIKLSLGSTLLLLAFACLNPKQENVNLEAIDTCKYNRYNTGQIISNLGCKNCHIQQILRMENIPTFSELSNIDSLKLMSYVFKRKHKGWYSKNGTFKAARMDTLSECEIKSVIRYIKDQGRDKPMSSQ